jgi:hypothetical protein
VTGSASAEPKDEYAVFKEGPLTVPFIDSCVYSATRSGQVTIGKSTVPITNPIVFQGGETRRVEGEAEFRAFVGAANGETLSHSPQPVPGGLAGLVNCPALKEPLEELTCRVVFENAVTGVNATTELAGIPEYSFLKLASHQAGLIMPVRVHLENPLLGGECFIGSTAEPIVLRLSTGTTEPPPPNQPISGSLGSVMIGEGGKVTAEGDSAVDNSFAVPGATGCGGPVLSSLLVDSVIDSKLGLPSPAGENTAILNGTLEPAPAGTVIASETP